MDKIIFKMQDGFSTLEIMIAMSVIILVISAVTLVSYSDQSILTDSQTDNRSMEIATESLLDEQSLARKDFRLVGNTSTTTDGAYQSIIQVTPVDQDTKEVTSRVWWNIDPLRTGRVELTSLITDFENTMQDDTCDSTLSGNWKNPTILNTITDLGTLVGDPTNTFTITDLGAYDNRLYVVTNNSSGNRENFFVFDITDKAHPLLISKTDNDTQNSTGMNAVTVASTTTHNFAYIASASSFTKGQLQIMDLSTSPPHIVKTFKIPSSIVSGGSTQGIGNSIFYADGYVYLGLTKTVSGPEFNIIDVHDPANPTWVGGYAVGNGVNALWTRGKYAYIASPNNQELITLDISDRSHPQKVSGYDGAGTGNGKSLYLIGDTLYLGRTVSSGSPELYILDITHPENPIPSPLGTQETNTSIDGLFVRDSLAFLLSSNGQFQIFDITNPATITQYATPLALPASGNSVVPSLDCEGNYFFAASNNAAGRGFLFIISPQQ